MRIVEGVAAVADVDDFVARLGAIGDEHDVAVQAVDARFVADRAHLERAVACANRAWARGHAIADDRAMEILLYAAGTRQIDRALALGVSPGEGPVAVVVDAGADAGEGSPDDAKSRETSGARAVAATLDEERPVLGNPDEERLRELFDVTGRELDAVEGTLSDLVRERVALLAVER